MAHALLAFTRGVAGAWGQGCIVLIVDFMERCRKGRGQRRWVSRNSEVGVYPGIHGAILLLCHHGDARAAVGPGQTAPTRLAAGGSQGKGGRAGETSYSRSAVIAKETVFGAGYVPPCTVGAEVTLDLPSRDAEAAPAVAEVGRGAAGAGEVVPAVAARQEGNVELGDAHGDDGVFT